jgi:hypothetical protein
MIYVTGDIHGDIDISKLKDERFMKKVKEGDDTVETGVVGGANFSVDRDVQGVVGFWKPFLEKLTVRVQ